MNPAAFLGTEADNDESNVVLLLSEVGILRPFLRACLFAR